MKCYNCSKFSNVEDVMLFEEIEGQRVQYSKKYNQSTDHWSAQSVD